MAKEKKKDLIDDSKESLEEALKTEGRVKLNSLTMKGYVWRGSITVQRTLPKSYHEYSFIFDFDEQPFLSRIDSANREADNSLFAGDVDHRKELDREILDIRKEMAEHRKLCERIEFSTVIESIKYANGTTTMTMTLPDAVIQPLNKQKIRMDSYKVTLIPVFKTE